MQGHEDQNKDNREVNAGHIKINGVYMVCFISIQISFKIIKQTTGGAKIEPEMG